MTEHDPHSSPIKTPKQLIIVVVLAFLVPVVIIGLLSQLFTSTRTDTSGDEQRVLERIKPVGSVVIADASGPKGNLTGEQVYGQICKTCHEAAIAGAPKTGDKTAWSGRIAQGEATLVQHAIAGFQGKAGVMPPKGGNMDLTDAEVHRAVVYLANQVGAGWKEPAPTVVASAAPATSSQTAAVAATAPMTAASVAAPTAAAAKAPAPATPLASAPTTIATAAPAASSGKSDGKGVYEKVCAVCHAAAIAGAPKFGDKSAWAPRIATGIDTLHASALKGKNAMPPKGGNLALPDADVMAAVDYMVAAAK
jgi:cytochrome c5